MGSCAYPYVFACLTEMPGENSAPCVCFSKLIFICTYIVFAHIYFTILFNMLSMTDPRSFSLEIWVCIFVFYIFSISSVIVDLLPAVYHSKSTVWISIQDLQSRSCSLLCHIGKIWSIYVSPLQCYWIALLFFKYSGTCQWFCHSPQVMLCDSVCQPAVGWKHGIGVWSYKELSNRS